MILSIIFLVLFVACLAVSIYRCISLVKSPMVQIDYKSYLLKNAIFVGGAIVSFLVASIGFYSWLSASPDALHVIQLVLGALLFSGGLVIAINCFIIHYYGKNIPEQLDKHLFRIQLTGFVVAFVSFYIYTNGLAPYLTYPLVNGLSFQDGWVSPATGKPNVAFYALCILSGAILVYFICDHYMYKEYGKHGLLESTFYVAFPAGIIGARIWFVIGEWETKFDCGRAMTYLGDMKVWAPLAIWEGGLTILGGAIMGIVVGVLFFLWRNKKLSIWYAVDMVVPTILIGQAVGRWGNFFNCEVHGEAVDLTYFKWLPEIVWRNAQFSDSKLLPSLIGTDKVYVPLFFIEFIINLFGYFLLSHVFGRALKKYTEQGDLCFGYVIWYGLTRVFLEPLRNEAFKMGKDGYWSWVWSMIFVFVGVLLIVCNHIIRLILKKKKNEYQAQPYDKKLGLISTVIIVIVGGALLGVGINLMSTFEYVKAVEYNGFHIGLFTLVLGVSVLLTLGISLSILIESIKNKPEVVHE